VIPTLDPLTTTKISSSICSLGSIPAEIGNLTALTHLDLRLYAGTIPPSIGKLVNLTTLIILSTGHSGGHGTLPPGIWKLDALEYLHIGGTHDKYLTVDITGAYDKYSLYHPKHAIKRNFALYSGSLYFCSSPVLLLRIAAHRSRQPCELKDPLVE
jgi:hypothetical protein